MFDLMFHRKTIRFKDWDYASEGAYYITLCTEKMAYLFGKVANENMDLNQLGRIVQEERLKTAELRPNVKIDEFVVMPNHLHGILMIMNNVRDSLNKIGRGELIFTLNKRLKSPSQTLGSIIRGFKSSSTRKINEVSNIHFNRVRQRDERIVRDYMELDKFRKYIVENPVRWSCKKDYPENITE